MIRMSLILFFVEFVISEIYRAEALFLAGWLD